VIPGRRFRVGAVTRATNPASASFARPVESRSWRPPRGSQDGSASIEMAMWCTGRSRVDSSGSETFCSGQNRHALASLEGKASTDQPTLRNVRSARRMRSLCVVCSSAARSSSARRSCGSSRTGTISDGPLPRRGRPLPRSLPTFEPHSASLASASTNSSVTGTSLLVGGVSGVIRVGKEVAVHGAHGHRVDHEPTTVVELQDDELEQIACAVVPSSRVRRGSSSRPSSA
jgi:hypothetical protein